MRGPGVFQGGKVCDAMISHLDLYPTVCEFIGVAKAEVSYHAAYEPKRAVRTHRYKYIRRFGDYRKPVLPNATTLLADMRGRLDRWMQRTHDPLLQGPIPIPPGAKVNPQDGISPRDQTGTRI